MAYETITVDVDNHVALITLNRPDRLNAFTAQMHEELMRLSSSAKPGEVEDWTRYKRQIS